jgi:hypothetical protein
MTGRLWTYQSDDSLSGNKVSLKKRKEINGSRQPDRFSSALGGATARGCLRQPSRDLYDNLFWILRH